jgi:hypothetical protein
MGPQDKKSNTRFSVEGQAACRLRGMTPQKICSGESLDQEGQGQSV